MSEFKITPPPELVEMWANQSPYNNYEDYIATKAAQWGADQELEACCEWVGAVDGKYGPRLRLARRPKPQGPTDQQLRVFACEWWRKFGFVKNKATCAWVIDEIDPEHFVDFLRDALARWGSPP